MASPKDPKPHQIQTNKPESTPPSKEGVVHEPERLVPTAAVSPNSPVETVADTEKADFRWKFENHSKNFRFFIDQGLKAVGLFYAIVGGIISIYFSRDPGKNTEVLKILLGVPFVLSLVLGVTFVAGAELWRRATKKIIPTARVSTMTNVLNFGLLNWLAWVFGVLFLVTGGALFWLISKLT